MSSYVDLRVLRWSWAHLALAWNTWRARSLLPSSSPYEEHRRFALRLANNRRDIECAFFTGDRR